MEVDFFLILALEAGSDWGMARRFLYGVNKRTGPPCKQRLVVLANQHTARIEAVAVQD